MGQEEIILEYKGHLTFSTIGRLLTLLKHKMVQMDIKIGIYKRILSVMIEALENIYKNSDSYQNNSFIYKNYLPTFKLWKNDLTYTIVVSNPILRTAVPGLKKKLELVNNKSYEELRILYRQTISNGKFSEKGGAGLGIIEMAKISGNPMIYTFEPIDKDYFFYTLQLTFS
jgi:hypothetical protein